MKRPAYYQLVFVLSTCLLLIFGGITAQAQEVNLLVNPGFESPFQTFAGQPDRLVASGWTPWHVPPTAGSSSAENQQPEYREAAPDTARIRSGSNAQLYFSYFATHTGGVYQRVTNITPGTELRFSVYAYIWSSTFEDVNLSDEPGDVIVYVGIDPTGGTDGTSANIVWSPAAPNQYDAYRQYSVIATAASNAVTVFVRSVVGFPVQNNYIYLDDAVLSPTTDPVVPTNTPPPPATNTPAPEDTPIPQPTDPPVVEEPTPTQEGAGLPTATVEPTATTVPPFIATATPIVEAPSPVPPATNTPTTVPVGGPVDANFPNTLIHTVRRGDTVGRLAVLYGSTIQAIIQANGLNEDALIFVGQGLIIPVPLAAPATSTPSPTPQVIIVTATPDFGTGGPLNIYIVQPGDTLFRIASRFNTTITALAQLNGIANPNRIQAGQQLLIPGTPAPAPQPSPTPAPVGPRTYVVQPGDNLYRISLRFNVSMLALSQANNIVNVNRIFAGQVLIIP